MSEKMRLLLFGLAGLLLLAGILIGFLPLMQKNEMLKHQNELLRSIEKSDGVLMVTMLSDIEIDFYDGDMAAYDYADNTQPAPSPTDEKQTTLEGIGIMEIKRINLRLPVVDGVRKFDLKISLGHVPSSPPIGETGNAVIAGHRSYTYGHFFNRLDEIRAGDTIRFTDKEGTVFEFNVYEILIVEPNASSVFDATEYPSITLLTCTPMRKATHRLIVRAALKEGI